MNIAVIGSSSPTQNGYQVAERIGRKIADMGAVLICGGLAGIMEAAAKGATLAGGTAVGILPGSNAKEANPYITIPVVTGMADARNVIVVRSADIVVAIEGAYGTLSEIAIACKTGKPVIGLNTWKSIDGVYYAQSVEEAMEKIKKISSTLPA